MSWYPSYQYSTRSPTAYTQGYALPGQGNNLLSPIQNTGAGPPKTKPMTAEEAFASQGTPLGPKDPNMPTGAAPPGKQWFRPPGSTQWQLMDMPTAPTRTQILVGGGNTQIHAPGMSSIQTPDWRTTPGMQAPTPPPGAWNAGDVWDMNRAPADVLASMKQFKVTPQIVTPGAPGTTAQFTPPSSLPINQSTGESDIFPALSQPLMANNLLNFNQTAPSNPAAFVGSNIGGNTRPGSINWAGMNSLNWWKP